MLVVMGTLRRFVGVRTIIVGEYFAAAAVLAALVYFAAAAPPQPGCVDTCFGGGIGLALFATAGLVVLAVGLPVALLIATVRQRRQRRRTATSRPTVHRGELAAATTAAAWGVAVALPLSCILALPVLQLLM
jgi:hypothetical protein